MKFFNRYIFTQIVTCLLLVLICLSCPIKRGIKQDIGIPLSTDVQLNKSSIHSVCSDYRKANQGHHRFLKADVGTITDLAALPTFKVLNKGVDLLQLNRKAGLGNQRTLFILYRKILI